MVATVRNHMLPIDGRKLREVRLRRLLTLAELAEKVEMNPSHLASLERGEVSTSRVRTIRRLAQALEIDPQEIISAPESPDTIGHPEQRHD